jgi:hypothetical protein
LRTKNHRERVGEACNISQKKAKNICKTSIAEHGKGVQGLGGGGEVA